MPFSPRKIQVLFLAVTLLFAGVLGFLGWRLLQQDRALARQRRFEQLEAAADRVSAAIYRRLAELDEALADPAKARLPPHAVLVRARRDGVDVRPADGLLYHPVPPGLAGPAAPVFAAGETIEFRQNDPARAAEVFRVLTRSGDRTIRAGAFLRLGRNLAKCGRETEALSAFAELASMGRTPTDGLPAELVALEARCTLFEKLGWRSELEGEARSFHSKLTEGGFPLSRASYEFKTEEVLRWLGEAPQPSRWDEKAALSAATEVIWTGWLQEPTGKGRRLLAMDGLPVLAAWVSSPRELTALLVPAVVAGSDLLEAGGFQARLIDGEGNRVLGRPAPAGKIRVERTPASTRLPWTLQVAAPDDGSGELAGRQWILAGGFALLVGLLGAVSYVAARAASKEVAVARLQADFVSAVSHEFRTPLSSICQIAELLNEDRWPSDEHRHRSFGILARESARLRRLVEGLLDFARMEAGAAQYRRELLPIEDLVRSVVEDFQAQPVSRCHEVQFTIAPELPEVEADREALGRAVWNLLDNAVKYSPDSTTVRVEALLSDGRLAIRVCDEGAGIPVDEQKVVFHKFVRGSQARDRGVKGTGIGLAMVRHIVEGHGGEIRLESALGRGSTFTILLPLRRLT